MFDINVEIEELESKIAPSSAALVDCYSDSYKPWLEPGGGDTSPLVL